MHVLADPASPTSGVRASGHGDGVTQRPPDGVVAEKPECTLVCILTRSLVTVAAAEQGGGVKDENKTVL